jgi:hypothetical protein
MPQVATPVAMTNFAAALADKPVRFWSEPLEFATWLAGLKGPQFMAYDAVFDMEAKGKMLVKHRVTKLPNPYVGRGLKKYSTTQVTVNFDYEAKVEAREGEFSGKGNWTAAVLCNGKPTPLTTHKDDVSEGPNGEQRFKSDCRLYLRCEIVRYGEGDKRCEKSMRSESEYRLADGTVVAYDDLKDYLPLPSERKDETDFITVTLSNIVELRAAGQVWRKWQPTGVNA